MVEAPRLSAGVRIEAVRISGFRVLRDVCVTLDPETTVLVGENNTGKSAFLEALETALGTRSPVPDDLHVDRAGQQSRESLVDLLLVPAEGTRFSQHLEALFGDAVRSETTQGTVGEGARNFVAIRTIGTIGVDHSTVDRRRCFVESWPGCDSPTRTGVMEAPTPRVAERHLTVLSFALLQANRDLVADMRRQTSRWGRLLAQRDLDQDIEKSVEGQLRELGELLLGNSSLLGRLRDRLDEARKAMPTVDEVDLEPLPSRVADLTRATDIIVSAPAGARLPLRMQGLGSRSLAEVLVYRAFVGEIPGMDEPFSPHIVAALEEPEAHLHPHAQLALMRIIDQIPGQRIVTTHSGQIAGTTPIRQVRVFRHSDQGIEVRHSGHLDDADEIKTHRLIARSYGQVLFARLAIIGDGTTERDALPVFARAHWGMEAEGLGVTFVDPGSLAAAKGLVKVLEDLAIPWLALVDDDKGGDNALRAIGKLLERTLDRQSEEVVMLPNGTDFERYLIDEGLQAPIRDGIRAFYGPYALARFSKQPNYRDWTEDDVLEGFLDKNKGTYGAAVAEAIVTVENENGKPTIPERVAELFNRADHILGMRSR